MINLVYILLILLGLAGLILAGYIHHKKTRREKLVCPVGFDCETVIYSRYSKFLGVHVEDIGIFYYLLVSISYSILLFIPQWDSDVFVFTILSATTIAFLFSIYLTYIQAVLLKEWCTWCLMSAGLCTIIFIIVWLTSDLNIIEFTNSLTDNIISIYKR